MPASIVEQARRGEVVERLKRGQKPKQIASDLGYRSRKSIVAIAREEGIEIATLPPPCWTVEQVDLFNAMFAAGKGAVPIAKAIGRPLRNVRDRMARERIAPRQEAEAMQLTRRCQGGGCRQIFVPKTLRDELCPSCAGSGIRAPRLAASFCGTAAAMCEDAA